MGMAQKHSRTVPVDLIAPSGSHLDLLLKVKKRTTPTLFALLQLLVLPVAS